MSLKEDYEKKYNQTPKTTSEPYFEEALDDNERLEYYLNKPGGKEQLLEAIHYIVESEQDENFYDEDEKYKEYPISFQKIHDAMEAVDWKIFTGDVLDGGDCEQKVPSALRLKKILRNQLFELFDKKCHSISGLWTTSYEVLNDEEFYESIKGSKKPADELDDFKHRVNIHVSFRFEEFNTIW